MGENPSTEVCCPNPERLERGGWQVSCAELSHAATARKLWPRFIRRKSRVTAQIYTEPRQWTVWENAEGDYVFAVSVCQCTNRKLYLKTSKGVRRTRLVIGRGKVPGETTTERDKRVFQFQVSALDNQLKIKHTRSGKYLYCDKKGNLRLGKKEQRADAWDLSRMPRGGN